MLRRREKILEQLKESRAADLIKLNDYTERESKEFEEKAKREEAARLKAEADRLRRMEEERNLWAATKCQALWRGYLSRQAAAGGGKKGKKGKKGARARTGPSRTLSTLCAAACASRALPQALSARPPRPSSRALRGAPPVSLSCAPRGPAGKGGKKKK